MFKSCSRCGRIHPRNYKCKVNAPKYSLSYGRTENEMTRYSWDWQKKSLEIRRASLWLCAVCKEHGVYTYDGLEVHHIVKLRDAPEKLLDNENLICLCRMHHRLADSGEISQEYLKKLAQKREQT